MKKLILTASLMLIALGACSKKEEPAKTDDATAQAVQLDPAIAPKDLIGTWQQTVDDDPNIYTFMENGKCKGKELTDKAQRDCTYELKAPSPNGSRYNMLIMTYPASGDQEEYYTKSRIQLSGDLLTFPDSEGNVSEFNKYKKVDPNAAPAKNETPSKDVGCHLCD